mmetsp:Transcript_77216/g.230024  ORF Transcript_77216/g.230024 Transcript_77216/m.230024 type:complete len:365 (+) Transcript_77216:408-1502(+)
MVARATLDVQVATLHLQAQPGHQDGGVGPAEAEDDAGEEEWPLGLGHPTHQQQVLRLLLGELGPRGARVHRGGSRRRRLPRAVIRVERSLARQQSLELAVDKEVCVAPDGRREVGVLVEAEAPMPAHGCWPASVLCGTRGTQPHESQGPQRNGPFVAPLSVQPRCRRLESAGGVRKVSRPDGRPGDRGDLLCDQLLAVSGPGPELVRSRRRLHSEQRPRRKPRRQPLRHESVRQEHELLHQAVGLRCWVLGALQEHGAGLFHAEGGPEAPAATPLPAANLQAGSQAVETPQRRSNALSSARLDELPRIAATGRGGSQAFLRKRIQCGLRLLVAQLAAAADYAGAQPRLPDHLASVVHPEDHRNR